MIHFNKKNNHSDLPYRPGVGLMIINSDNKIFLGKRIDSKLETWQMPQGGIDLGETPSSAVIREMNEEIGTNNGIIIAESKYWYSYDVPKFLIPKLWDGKYRGQQQKWFLIRYKGEDSEININTDVPEFCDWRWIEFDELLEVVIAFKKDLYKAVIKEFKSILKKENIIT